MSVVWPFAPIVPHLEALEWLTDVQASRSGKENRTSLRSNPRQTFEMDFYLKSNAEMGRFEALSYTSQDQTCLIPWWPGKVEASGLSIGQTVIPCEPTGAGFVQGGQVLVIQEQEVWENKTISSIGESSITLSSGLSSAYGTAWVIALRSCRMDLSFSRKDILSNISFGETTFTSESPEVLEDIGSAVSTWQGIEIWPQAVWIDSGGMQRNGKRLADDVDNQVGSVHRVVFSDSTLSSSSMKLIATTRAECLAVRQFIFRREGKLNPFWAPSSRQDLLLSQNVSSGASTMRCFSSSALQAFISPVRNALAFYPLDGTPFYRTVTDVSSVVGGYEDITFSETLPDIDKDRTRISWISLSRLDSDRIEFSWEMPDLCVVECNIVEILQ